MIYVHAHGKGRTSNVSRVIKVLRHVGDDHLRIKIPTIETGFLLTQNNEIILTQNNEKIKY